MTINDVREIAAEKNIPSRAISRLVANIETDENGNVKDELDVLLAINQMSYNYDHIRGALECIRRTKEKRKQ